MLRDIRWMMVAIRFPDPEQRAKGFLVLARFEQIDVWISAHEVEIL